MLNAAANNQNLGQIIASARNLYVSACAAEIPDLSNLLRQYRPRDATITGIFSPLVNRRSYVDPDMGLRVRTFFLTRQIREQLAGGLVEYCPWRYLTIDGWLKSPGRFDTALVMLSPPDRHGNCSLGVQADFLPSFLGRVDRIVGFINPEMPRTFGDTVVDSRALTCAVDCAGPLVQMRPKPPDAQAIAIAARIAELIQDDSTLQFGIGQIPSQVMARLAGHRGLRVHSGIIDDNILALEASGALEPGMAIVTGTAIGTAALYSALHESARFRFKTVAHTHSSTTIGQLRRFTAVNSVLQVDLLGQMTAETSGGPLVASPGGLPDFVRASMGSDSGQSVIAVRARGSAGHPGGIVPLLGGSRLVTLSPADADVIVTEFGSASVRYLSVDARAEAIIAIAAPEDRSQLLENWREIRRGLIPGT
jgi:acyl-CoA hydrolase